MKRTRVLVVVLGLLATSGVASATANSQQEYRFNVYLDDNRIGHHHFRVIRDGKRKVVHSTADFAVRLLFITAYTYQHSNVERWDGGCVQSIRSTTDDNGKGLAVAGNLRDTELHLTTPAGSTSLAGCVRTFAYWDPGLLDASRLLNAQTGEYVPVTVTDRGYAPLPGGVPGAVARQVRIDGDGKLMIDLWYSADNEWLALESVTDSGARLRYRRD